MKNGDWVKWVLGLLVSISLAISGYHFNIAKAMADHIIANDKDARLRDEVIKENLVKTTTEQGTVNTQILITLAKMDGKFDSIAKDIGYLKEKTK